MARINIENRSLLALSGLTPGISVRVEFGADFIFVRKLDRPEWDSITISPKRYQNRDGSESLGGRLDIRRIQTASIFPDEQQLLAAYMPEGVLITLLPTRKKARGRWDQLVRSVRAGVLRTGSVFTGIGTLDAALHAGLSKSGLRAKNEFANDNWEDALEAMLAGNPARPRRALAAGIEQVITLAADTPLPEVDFLAMGVPCKGASKLNVSTRDLPERHPQVGHQVLNVAMLLQSLKWNTPILLIENVVPWADTISYSMLCRVLEEQGYKTMLVGGRTPEGQYEGLNGAEYGDFERRRRMALLAYPPELEKYLNFDLMEKRANERTIASIRLPEEMIPADDYARGPGMAAKAERGWTNKVVNDEATSTPSCSSECWKIRPEDPKFTSPTAPEKWRLPKPEEHARLKGQPEELFHTLRFDTAAHTALGNGTCRKVWLEFGRCLGLALMKSVASNEVAGPSAN